MYLDQLLPLYINDLHIRNYSQRSIESYRSDLRYLVHYFKGQQINGISKSQLLDFQRYLFLVQVKNKRLASSTQSRILTVVRMFFRFALKNDYLDKSPAESIELPREERRLPRTILTESEVEKLIEAADLDCPLRLRNRAIMELFYATGIRVSELINLDIYSMSEDLTIRIQGKGRKERIVPVNGRSQVFILEYQDELRPKLKHNRETSLLFLSQNGKRLHRADVSLLIRSFAEKAGIKKQITPHVIRHSIATHLLKNGMDIRYIQELLGHEDLRTTQRYTKVENTDLKAMLEKHHPLR